MGVTRRSFPRSFDMGFPAAVAARRAEVTAGKGRSAAEGRLLSMSNGMPRVGEGSSSSFSSAFPDTGDDGFDDNDNF